MEKEYVMPKYSLKASYGYDGTDTDFGEYEFDNEEEAQDAAWEAACEQVSSYVELVEDDS